LKCLGLSERDFLKPQEKSIKGKENPTFFGQVQVGGVFFFYSLMNLELWEGYAHAHALLGKRNIHTPAPALDALNLVNTYKWGFSLFGSGGGIVGLG